VFQDYSGGGLTVNELWIKCEKKGEKIAGVRLAEILVFREIDVENGCKKLRKK